MSLYVRRNEGETWRECVARVAKQYGLADECLIIFDTYTKLWKVSEACAAWEALEEWDCLSFRDDDAETEDRS